VLDFFRPVPKKRTVKLLKKTGIIFRNPGRLGKALFHLGNVLLLGAISYSCYLYWPLASAVWGYWQMPKYQPGQPIPTLAPVPTLEVGSTSIAIGTTEYSIFVPRIGAAASIAVDVSPFNQAEYSRVLKNNVVAQAKGSADAGMGKGRSTFIFAHSTEQGMSLVRQNSIFYLLGELKDNDRVLINKAGDLLTYRVYMQKIVNASEIEYLKYADPEREVLILQTCWPLGTDWKRLLVFAERV
jgi:LPXTG-site transpeptidase (sortase) family protein